MKIVVLLRREHDIQGSPGYQYGTKMEAKILPKPSKMAHRSPQKPNDMHTQIKNVGIALSFSLFVGTVFTARSWACPPSALRGAPPGSSTATYPTDTALDAMNYGTPINLGLHANSGWNNCEGEIGPLGEHLFFNRHHGGQYDTSGAWLLTWDSTTDEWVDPDGLSDASDTEVADLLQAEIDTSAGSGYTPITGGMSSVVYDSGDADNDGEDGERKREKNDKNGRVSEAYLGWAEHCVV